MNQRYTAQKRPGIGGPPIPDDEPFLVIRAQDVLAPLFLHNYIVKYSELEGAQSEVIEELHDHLHELLRWQMENGDKVKVADR